MRDFKQARSRSVRWGVPVTAVAVTGAAIASGTIGSASAAPVLPAKTPAQLLAGMASTHKLPPLIGTVVETTSLGLPQLPQTGNPTSLSSLLTGSHTVRVYWQDAKHFRLQVPQSLSETDIVRNGSTAWLWESNQNAVTKFTAGPKAAPKAGAKTGAKARPADNSNKMPDTAPLTPQQAASDILAKVGKTTVVSTQSNVDVAGRAAYQLVLAPKSAQSTIGSIRIAIDGATGVPLRLQVFAKGAKTPAFQVGYQSISFTTPSAANFAFTPPPGAKVTTPGQQGAKGAAAGPAAGSMAGAGTYGSGWLAVAELPSSVLMPGSSGTGGPSSPAPGASPANGSPLSGNSQEIMSAILGSARTVSGSWGRGQLVHTSLLNVLITGGKLYIGAVTPHVLEAAVGHAVTSNG